MTDPKDPKGPRPSPHPFYLRRIDTPGTDEPGTDPGVPVYPDYVKRKLDEQLTKHDNRLTWRSVVIAAGTLMCGIGSSIMLIDNRVAAQTDAGIRVHEQRITTLEQQRNADRTEMNGRLERVEKNQQADHDLTLGVSQKVDKLLERFQVPNPSPAPKDGGK